MDIHVTWDLIRTLSLIIIGLPLINWFSKVIHRRLSGHLSPHFSILISQSIFYLGMGLLTITVLKNMGFELSAFLGTAGIIGISIGFAAQTTISNIISGAFLLVEDTFQVGDTITCNYFAGKVESIHIFSTILTTEDNKIVRVPNEFLLKNPITITKK